MITSAIDDINVAGSSLSSSNTFQNETTQSASLIQNILNQLKAQENQQELVNKQQEQQQQQHQQQQQQQQQYQFEQRTEEVQLDVEDESLKEVETTKQSQVVKDTTNQDQLREQLKSLLKSGQIRIRKSIIYYILAK